jgi:hypothetical protein
VVECLPSKCEALSSNPLARGKKSQLIDGFGFVAYTTRFPHRPHPVKLGHFDGSYTDFTGLVGCFPY